MLPQTQHYAGRDTQKNGHTPMQVKKWQIYEFFSGLPIKSHRVSNVFLDIYSRFDCWSMGISFSKKC